MEESASLICSNLSNECVLEELIKIIARTRGNCILIDPSTKIHHERHLDISIGDDQVVTSGSKKAAVST